MAAKNSPFTTQHPLFTIQYSLFRTPRNARGQVLVEYAIVFPIQLMLTLAIIQLAHIFVAKHVLEYASFCGARAALVGYSDEESKRAAVIPIARIAGSSGVLTPDTIEIPGWGTLANSGAAEEKTSVDIIPAERDGTPVIQCEIIHQYELRVPIGNFVAYKLGDVFLGLEDFKEIGGAPHLDIRATCSLAQPWEE